MVILNDSLICDEAADETVDQVVDDAVDKAVDETVVEAVDDAGPIAVTPEHLQVGEEQDTIGTEMQSMDDIQASSSPEHNLDPSVSCGDFHTVVKYKNSKQRELSDHEKHFLLNHHFIPNATYKFPANTCGKQHTFSAHLVSKIQRFGLFKKCG